MAVIVYRIQDKDGRGPFRPGITNQWCDYLRDASYLLPWYREFGTKIIEDIQKSKLHKGTATIDKATLKEWFTKAEYARLKALGYRAVEIDADIIFGESKWQCVFGCKNPLRAEAKKFELY